MVWTRSMDDQDALDEPGVSVKCRSCGEYFSDGSIECKKCFEDAYADYLYDDQKELRCDT